MTRCGWLLAAAAGMGALGSVAVVPVLGEAPAGTEGDSMAAWKARYVRPTWTPFPSDNPYSEAKVRLGRTLFFDRRLSGGDTMACADCHNPALAWEDGRRTAVGETGQTLERHTPTLWNLAWGEFFFWDGRAASLEDQALVPVQAATEMNQSLEELVASLNTIAAYRDEFAAAFPDEPTVTPANTAKALAAFERTLVSPETSFDRWIAGDELAIGEAAKRGFALFNNKANCAACHSGWAFTDHAFHDIGLPGTDPGRGKVLALPEVEHAFKTPTLRDITRRAPYMHDGSLATLEAVVDHYNGGFERRPTLSGDMRTIDLSTREKADLLAFLATLAAPDTAGTSASLPPPRVVTQGQSIAEAAPIPRVSQRNKTFQPDRVILQRGDTLRVFNDDSRTHNLRVHDPDLDYNSGAQEPGETVDIRFDQPGTYYVFCGIHPKMKLVVKVRGS